MQTTCTDHTAVPLRNAPDEVDYRKAASTLVNVGRMVLIFSGWTIVRTLGVAFINRRFVIEAVRRAMDGQEAEYLSDAVLFFAVAFRRERDRLHSISEARRGIVSSPGFLLRMRQVSSESFLRYRAGETPMSSRKH